MDNRAVPKYYKEFRDQVIRGEIPICLEIDMEMQRIDKLIADPNVYYDPTAVEGYISFCEAELTKTDGTPFTVLPTFKLWAEQLLGWYIYEETTVIVHNNGHAHYERRKIRRRLIKKQYLIVARGTAKTMYEETMQAYFLSLSKKTIHCVTVGPTMKQAEEVLIPFRTAIIRHPGPYFKFLTQGIKSNTRGAEQFKPKLFSSKRGIEFTPTGSLLEIRPMSITKLQGLRPFLSTVDEWLSVDNREDVIAALEQGASKLPDYIIIAVSSEGTFRNGSGDDIKLELRRILSGEYSAPHVSIFHYKLDDISEVANPAMWPKAAPNIGLTVSYQVFAEDVVRAEQVPHARNDILAKRFGIPMEGFTYFFTYDETQPHRPMLMRKTLVSLGADMSMGDDFCSFGFLTDIGTDLYAFTSLSFITEKTLQKLPPSLRNKYDEFIEEGSLVVLEGTTIDPEKLYEQFDDFATRYQFDFGAFGYDPYNASAFVKQYIAEHSEHSVLKVPQTFKMLSVPLGDIKHLMEERRIVFWQKIVTYTMGNAMVLKDTLGNQRLYKKRGEHKIDVVAALIDAWIARQAHPESFV